MKRPCIALLLASTATITRGAFAQENRPDPSSAPTTFHADEVSFELSVRMPPKVLAALVKTEAGKEGLEFASVRQKPVLDDLSRAVEVHLDNSRDAALMVSGVGWMSGAG